MQSLIRRADESVRGETERLINDGAIEKPVHEDITYDEIYKTDDNLWNFMFFMGYLRKESEKVADGDIRYLTMGISNREMRYIFREKIRS